MYPGTYNNRCRVAIVGAGAGGLVVCHRLTTKSKDDDGANRSSTTTVGSDAKPPQMVIDVTVFEQTDHVGGTWYYADRPAIGLPKGASIYKNLRTNLAKEVMPYLDFPFPANGPSFIHHTEVLRYLNDYCDANELRKYIKFNIRVTKAWPFQRPGTGRTGDRSKVDDDHADRQTTYWHVETELIDNASGKRTSSVHEFDAIAVCNGHYYLPKYPEIPGLRSFRGLMHSYEYRVPEPFAKKRIVCLGSGPSSWDVALEVSRLDGRVFLCSKKPLPFSFPANVRPMPWPVSCDVDRVTFSDGQVIEDVDVIVVCTGYQYDYPFLVEDAKCDRPLLRVMDDGDRVGPLYKHMFHVDQPSLALFGVPKTVVPFCLMDVQAQVFRKTLEGAVLLPSTEVMRADEERQVQAAAPTSRHFHKMNPTKMSRYIEDLEQFGCVEHRIPPFVYKMYAAALDTIPKLGIDAYRELNYGTTHDDFFMRNLDGSPIVE